MGSWLVELLNQRQGSKPRKKTMVLPSRRDRPLGRRRFLNNKKYLNIYDFSQLADGTDISFYSNYAFALPASYTPFVPSIFGNGTVNFVSNPPILKTDWYAFIFGLTDWADTFKNITADLAPYHIDVANVDPYISGKGRLIPADVTALRGTNGLGWDSTASDFFPAWLDAASSDAIKITKIADPSATAETLTIDKSVDVFLTPAFANSSGTVKNFGATEPPFPYLPQTWYLAVPQFRSLSRADALNNSVWDSIWSKRSNISTLNTGERDFLKAEFINNGTLELITAQADLADYVNPGFDIPSGKISSSTAGLPFGGTAHNQISINGALMGNGLLVAAVRKHITTSSFEWYYVWSQGSWSSFAALNVASNFEL